MLPPPAIECRACTPSADLGVMRFFVGLHQPSDAWRFAAACISVNRLRTRSGGFRVHDWILDSGAFSTLSMHGRYLDHPEEYVEEILHWRSMGRLLAAVTQDYMCEPAMLQRTGMTVQDHQRLTIDRYDWIRALVPRTTHIMPVLQGYAPVDYQAHLRQYGRRIPHGAWVGVGSVCKRNGTPIEVYRVLHGILSVRPDLRLHGFGLKITALQSSVRHLLYSADSMAWSFRARMEGRDRNSWQEAAQFVREIEECS